MKHLDGATSDPSGFTGSIEKALISCEKMPTKRFKRIDCSLPLLNEKELSSDQRHLHEMCQAISTGKCPTDLSIRNPGLLSHSRWLTTANRILRLYVAVDHPTEELSHLVTHVMKVYALVWFTIKSKPSCKDEARHVFQLVSKSRYLSEDLINIIDPVIQHSAFFAHPENFLISMIADDRKHIRELGIRRLLKYAIIPNLFQLDELLGGFNYRESILPVKITQK